MKKISKKIMLVFLVCFLSIAFYCKDKEIDDIFPFLDKGVGHWEKTSKMIIPRDSTASAVLLEDGNVLISGGYGNKQYQETAEIYYPKENVFRATGALNHKRAGHSSFLLKDGKVVILGGMTPTKEGYTNDVELYIPKENKFVITNTLPERFENNSVLLNNGYIVSQKAIYNPITKDYKKIDINYARADANLININNSIYVTDGWVINNYPYGKLNNTIKPNPGEGYVLTNKVEKYNFKNQSYNLVGESIIPTRLAGLIELPNGRILIVGGDAYKASGSRHQNGILDYSVYKNNIYPLYKKGRKDYWWWKNHVQYLTVYNIANGKANIVGQKLQYTFGGHRNYDLIMLKNRYVFVANGRGRRAELIDTQTWINYPVKKMPKPILTSSIPIKIDENTILFIGQHFYKPLPYCYIYRLEDIKE